jgi:2-keto-4-pentenoate hydratase/2-oxohepta-3-ene-1,7-dioic acid hydratase in catechol pathway
MKLARCRSAGSVVPVLEFDDDLYDLSPLTVDIDGAFLASGGLDRIRSAWDEGALRLVTGGATLKEMAAPIARPGKIICIGLNYRDHAEETGATLPREPVVFMKDPSTVIGPFETILIPRGSVKTDWEIELGVVIGSNARYLDSPDDAMRHVAGFVVSHDVSEREFQLERGGQWDKGKSCETFNPLGPYLVSADDVPDPQDLRLRLSVNGTLRQNGTTADMIFSVAHVIWYLSQFMVLHPGDLINTGTPAGVALGLPDKPFLRAGDVVELEIDGLGRARQTVGAA